MGSASDEYVEAAVADLRKNGFHIARSAIPAAFCDELRAAIDQLERDRVQPVMRNPFAGYQTWRFYDLLNYDPIWQQL